MKKKAIIHIGGHKTGTTAIQAFCVLNADNLQQMEVVYPLDLLTNREKEGLQAHHGLVNFFMNDKSFWKNINLQPKLVADIGNYLQSLSRNQNILLSSENLTWLDEESIVTLKKLLDGYDVYIVLYARRQDNALQALYQTIILSDNGNNNKLFDECMANSYCIFDYNAIAEKWGAVFGFERVIVRVYEKNQMYLNDTVSDFIHVLENIIQKKIDITNWKATTGIINRGMPAHIIAMIRYYNGTSEKAKIVPAIKKIGNLLYKDMRNSYETISPSRRKELLKNFEESNKQLAKKFLKREDGVLFQDTSIEQTDEEWNSKYNWNGCHLKILFDDIILYLEKFNQ